MTDITWPAGVPDDCLRGWRWRFPDRIKRSEMDSGPAKIRPLFTAAPRRFSLTLELTLDQARTFETWFDETLAGGGLSFRWTDPRDGGARVFRFVTPPPPEPRQREDAPNWFRVELILELLP